jgi:O-antigen polymerase
MFKFLKNLKAIEILLAVLFIFAPLYYHSNIGGLGLRIPANIVIWMAALVTIGYSIKYAMYRGKLVLPQNYIGLLLFPSVAFLSLFIYNSYGSDYVFRVITILTGALFFIGLFQFSLKRQARDKILFFIVLSATLQGGVAVFQTLGYSSLGTLFSASEGIPTGTFQQVNNMAVFQVISILISIYLVKRPQFKSYLDNKNILIYVSVSIACYVITSSGSRVSILSLFIGLALIMPSLINGLKKNKNKYLILLIMTFVGVGAGLHSEGVERLEQKTMALKSDYSSAARVAIYEISFELIKQKPWFGSGPSQFAKVWQEEKVNYQKQNLNVATVNSYVAHPHNEILLWLVEVGLIVTVTLLIFGLTILTHIKKDTLATSLSYLALLTPIVIHTQVELPFYTSALLFFVFLFLLMQMSSLKTINKQVKLNNLSLKVSNLGLLSILAISIIFLIHSFKSSYEFKQFYVQRDINVFDFAPINPFFKDDYQWLYHRTVAFAVINGSSIDQQVMSNLIDWYKEKINERPDTSLFGDLIQLQVISKDYQEACFTLINAFNYYPNNSRLKEFNNYIKCQ